MGLKVGIPRALFYHYYYPLWFTFLQELGAEVILSPPSNKLILNDGVKLAVDEACLPIKLFYGHLASIKDRVDVLFVPRIVSVESKAFICPKFMGLPDMIRATIQELPPLIDVRVDLRNGPKELRNVVRETGRFFTRNSARVRQAWDLACQAYREFRRLVRQGLLIPEAMVKLCGVDEGVAGELPPDPDGGFKLAVLGHGYNIYDRSASMDLLKKLRLHGVSPTTVDNLDEEVVDREAATLSKRLFWSLGKRVLGGTFYYLKQPDIKGIIHLESFGCGPDSLVGDLVERFIRRERRVPFLSLTVDEHTGEAGVETRLEAFVDMIRWRAAL